MACSSRLVLVPWDVVCIDWNRFCTGAGGTDLQGLEEGGIGGLQRRRRRQLRPKVAGQVGAPRIPQPGAAAQAAQTRRWMVTVVICKLCLVYVGTPVILKPMAVMSTPDRSLWPDLPCPRLDYGALLFGLGKTLQSLAQDVAGRDTNAPAVQVQQQVVRVGVLHQGVHRPGDVLQHRLWGARSKSTQWQCSCCAQQAVTVALCNSNGGGGGGGSSSSSSSSRAV